MSLTLSLPEQSLEGIVANNNPIIHIISKLNLRFTTQFYHFRKSVHGLSLLGMPRKQSLLGMPRKQRLLMLFWTPIIHLLLRGLIASSPSLATGNISRSVYLSQGHGKQGGQSDHTARNATPNMTQIELSITEITLALAPKSSILNQPHPPPLILASSWCPDNHCHMISAAPPRP
jgi:hypothetical protein